MSLGEVWTRLGGVAWLMDNSGVCGGGRVVGGLVVCCDEFDKIVVDVECLLEGALDVFEVLGLEYLSESATHG